VKAPLPGTDQFARRMPQMPDPVFAPLRPLDLLRRPMRLPGLHMGTSALARPFQPSDRVRSDR
jgi:NTE family protein